MLLDETFSMSSKLAVTTAGSRWMNSEYRRRYPKLKTLRLLHYFSPLQVCISMLQNFRFTSMEIGQKAHRKWQRNIEKMTKNRKQMKKTRLSRMSLDGIVLLQIKANYGLPKSETNRATYTRHKNLQSWTTRLTNCVVNLRCRVFLYSISQIYCLYFTA